MKLYEINAALAELLNQVDPETGELMVDGAALDALMIQRGEKLEGMALTVKNLDAEASAIKAEESALSERRKKIEKHRDSLKGYLQTQLAGEKLETARVAVLYRKSKSVDILPSFWDSPNPAFLRQTVEPDKKKIMDALKAGATIPGTAIVEKQSMTIK